MLKNELAFGNGRRERGFFIRQRAELETHANNRFFPLSCFLGVKLRIPFGLEGFTEDLFLIESLN